MWTVALCDANALYSGTLRDLLLRLALARVIRIHTTERILDETFDNLRANRPDLDSRRLLRTRLLMIRSLPDLIVHDYEDHIESLSLPDPNDRHVLAAAIQVGADVILTSNLKDFPAETLAQHGLSAESPDAFLCRIHAHEADRIIAVARDMATAWRSPDTTIEQVIDSLAVIAPQAADLIRASLVQQQ